MWGSLNAWHLADVEGCSDYGHAHRCVGMCCMKVCGCVDADVNGHGKGGTSPIRKRQLSQDPPRTLSIGLPQGPRGMRFLVTEVPLYLSDVGHADGLDLQGYLTHKNHPPRRTLQ